MVHPALGVEQGQTVVAELRGGCGGLLDGGQDAAERPLPEDGGEQFGNLAAGFARTGAAVQGRQEAEHQVGGKVLRWGGGRPRPWMCLRIALEFRLDAISAAVKVGDTVSDIEEGLKAGMWTIGISRTGNEVGLDEVELAALSEPERTSLVRGACETLRRAGAHEVVESVAALEAAIESIDRRLAAGERP